MDLKRHIRDVPDFPEPGVRFRDTAPLLQDGKAFQHAVDGLIASGGDGRSRRQAGGAGRT